MSIRTITEPAVDIRKATKVGPTILSSYPGGKTLVVEADTPVDVPRFRMARADQFERSWHLAAWVPNDPEGPTVRVNVDSPILEGRHLSSNRIPRQVTKTVYRVFGEAAACKIAHSQKLTKEIPEQELNRDYRSEKPLTLSLMGLIAKDTLIGQ
jgi:hypothetical protein